MHSGQTQSFLFGKPEILWIYNFGYQFCNSDGTGKWSKDISCQRPGFDFTRKTKGQLISKCPFGIIVSNKIPTSLYTKGKIKKSPIK